MNMLVAIPAFGCDGGLYAEIGPALSEVIAMQTVIADRDRIAGCVNQVLASTPEKFIVMGTSFGGRVALEIAIAAPQRVMGLIVIGSGAGPVADHAAGLRRAARIQGGEMETVLKEMGDMVSHLPGPNGHATRNSFVSMGRKLGADSLARQADALAHRTNMTQMLDGVLCPALMLWGQHDQFSPATDGLKLSAAVANGRYIEIPECGHFPTLEAPVESLEAIRHWLLDHHLA